MLIEAEQDDKAVLQAEDEAILATIDPPPIEEMPLGADLERLIESIEHDGAPSPVHGGTES